MLHVFEEKSNLVKQKEEMRRQKRINYCDDAKGGHASF
jgi:hypothetical protein